MAAQFYEYMKNYCIVYFEWVNSMVCELFLNKTVIKKTSGAQIGNTCQKAFEMFISAK